MLTWFPPHLVVQKWKLENKNNIMLNCCHVTSFICSNMFSIIQSPPEKDQNRESWSIFITQYFNLSNDFHISNPYCTNYECYEYNNDDGTKTDLKDIIW